VIRSIQAVDWGLLPPLPVALHPRVSVLAGQNGSGKSSAMDGLKALLGVNRFGQNRTAASYIHDGRDLVAPAQEAFLLACCHGQPGQLRFADDTGNFTLAMWVTRSRRLFLALPGHLILGDPQTGEGVADDLARLKERYPRKSWYSPDDYQRRVLDPLGATRAVQRILSIPQGQAQRLLDARPDQLLANLLGLMGALEPLQELDARRGEYQEAQQERDRAHRALLEEQVRAANAERELADDARLTAAQAGLDAVQARGRGAIAAALAQLDDEAEQAEQETRLRAEKRAGLIERQRQLEEQTSAAAAAPQEYGIARDAAAQLEAEGVNATVMLENLAEQNAAPEQVSAMREWLCAVMIPVAQWDQARAACERFPQVTFIRADDPARWWQAQTGALGAAELVGDTHVQIGEDRLRPTVQLRLPVVAVEPDAVDTVRRSLWELDREDKDHTRQQESRDRRRGELLRHRETLGEGETVDADAEQLPGLLAERSRLIGERDALARAEKRRVERLRQLHIQRERLAEAEQFMRGQEGALETAKAALSEARRVYQRQVQTLIATLDKYFRQLCEDAHMRGELSLTPDPLAEAGGRLNVKVAESPNAPLRAYSDADLSGGWRSRTAVLVLLAALCAAGGEQTLSVVLLDEHAAQLDESAIDDLGWVMQTLSRNRRLQLVLTMPTKRTNEATSWADLQVAFLKAAPDQAYAPLPHLLEASDEATVPPAQAA